jgi:uncharacterized NAD(P)/FAD-binding protein YdhS
MIDDVKYCILGTGFAGTCTLWHLVDQLTSPQRLPAIAPPRITIVTVERGAVNGPGYPYLEANVLRSHRCNNQASTMAIHGNDFVDWMTEHKPRLVRDYPDLVLETHPGIELAAWQPDGDNFYPRSLFGRYLTERFDEAVERAIAHGIHVQHYLNHEVIDASPQGDRLSIRLRNLETDHELWIGGFDRALLSTGHWQTPVPAALAGRDGYLASPYPPAAVKTALAAALRTRRVERPCVFVQGMGPSGIDAILTVCDDGEFIYTPDGHVASYRPAASSAGGAAPRVIVGSRCGLFSLVRGPLVDYQMRYLTEEALAAIRRDHQGHAKIERVLELVERELRHATAGALGWGDIEQPALPVARDKLSDALRESHTG